MVSLKKARGQNVTKKDLTPGSRILNVRSGNTGEIRSDHHGLIMYPNDSNYVAVRIETPTGYEYRDWSVKNIILKTLAV